MAGGELRGVRLRTLTYALLAAAVVLVGAIGPAAASNDPKFSVQWNLAQIGAPAVWGRSTGAGIRIGIVDTGVHLTQEDLAGKVVAQTSCIGSNGNPAACSGSGQDDNGHGTHVSGIATAYKDNGRGIAGVAPDAQLVVAKALASDGSGSADDVNAGIKWVVDHGARVVNLSLGSDVSLLASLFGGDTSLSDGVEYAWSHGAVAVLAAGNTNYFGLGSSNYGSADAIVVGATQPSGAPAGYSSPIGSAKWGVMAPGGAGNGDANDVLSTFWDKNNPSSTNSYAYEAGTSMATPHVSGTVALLLAEGLSRDAAVQRIVSTAVPVPDCSASTCGHGLVNLPASVGTGGGGGGSTGGSGGTTAAPSGGSPARVVKAPATTARPGSGATTTASPDGSTTTGSPSSTEPVPGDNPVVAAGRLPGQHNDSGGRPSRALQVGAAIALLGGAGLGVGLLLRLRGGAAP